jgi:hypothetical protein
MVASETRFFIQNPSRSTRSHVFKLYVGWTSASVERLVTGRNVHPTRLHCAKELVTECLLMPAQLMFGDSNANASGSGLPLVAQCALAMQASIMLENM